ncbi:hypothetical protein [Skermanella pratensis]|uniref:hypothetical protein n=1 Tax=Skermanella pratensis TaxID=2233999 RepID=UPI00178896FF|nr:hypothetical protein [Skermanella pratensis]
MDRRTTELLPACALFIGGLVVSGVLTLSPRSGHAVMVVFDPRTAVTDAVSRVSEAGWQPVAAPRSFIIIARPDALDNPRHPDDAYLLLDARAMSGCLPADVSAK